MLLEQARMQSEEFFARLGERLEGSGDDAGLGLEDTVLPDVLSPALAALATEVEAQALRAADADVRMELQARSKGLDGLVAMLANLCRPGSGPEAPVRWLERHKDGAMLCSAPLSVRAALRQHLFGSGRTAVLTSATLGPGDDRDFAWLREQLGLLENFDTLRLGSPFDYRAQVELIVEEAMPDPVREAEAFLREACERCTGRVLENGGRALCLCTSWSFVRALAARLRQPLQQAGIELLVQGEAPLVQLLQRKMEVATSVLVGTDSLWEGIDLRGDACTLVVVTRLPFHNPGHPLTKARMRAIEQQGGDPFGQHSLPEAVQRFRQGFGRLIRSKQDRGKVVVLDPRARTRAYGRKFLQALPFGLA
jgi:ATP-dependent DNA helicase DinG